MILKVIDNMARIEELLNGIWICGPTIQLPNFGFRTTPSIDPLPSRDGAF
jgi:hypothetical protein